MAIKTNVQRQLDESRFMPRLMKFAKGIKLDNKPRDTDKFQARFSDARFSPAMQTGVELLYQSEALDEIHNAYLLTDNPLDDVSYFRAFEHWGRGLLQKRCDGETILKWWDKATQTHRFAGDTREENPLSPACTGAGAARDCGCKITGRLRVILPDLIAAAQVPYGYVEVCHTSWRDDASISACLKEIERRFALPNQIPLSRVPLLLFRQPVPAITKDGTKKTENVIRVSVDMQKFNELLKTQGLSSLQVASLPVEIRDEDALDDEQAILSELDEKDAPAREDIDPRYQDLSDFEATMLNELDRLAAQYLGSIEALDLIRGEVLEIASWSNFFAVHKTLDTAKRAIAKALAIGKLGVFAYGLETIVENNATRYAVPFGFGRALFFSRDTLRAAGFKIGKTSKLFQAAGQYSFRETLKVERLILSISEAQTEDKKTRYFSVASVTKI